MSDLISRDKVIEIIWGLFNSYGNDSRKFIPLETRAIREFCSMLQAKIEKQLPVEAPKWIPCSERLPECNGVYQITRKINDGERIYYIPDSAYFDGTSTWHDDTRVNHSRPYLKNVLAWMPLSKAYKGEIT